MEYSTLTITNDNNDSKKVIFNEPSNILETIKDRLNSKFYQLINLKLDYIEERSFFGIEFYYLGDPNDESNKYFCIATISDFEEQTEKLIKELVGNTIK